MWQMHGNAIAGGLIGGFFATNLGRSTIAGIEGWRCAFHLVALVSLVTAGLTLWLAVDPRRKLAVRLSLRLPGVGDSQAWATNLRSCHLRVTT